MIFRCAGITDSFNDGGNKIGLDIFFQGCEIGCRGCQNPELQDKNGGFDYDTEDVIDHIKKYPEFYGAVVFLGGEPTQQEEALIELATRVREIGLSNVLYTGRVYENLSNRIVDLMDRIIDGPYVENLKTNGFPASSNQRIIDTKMN